MTWSESVLFFEACAVVGGLLVLAYKRLPAVYKHPVASLVPHITRYAWAIRWERFIRAAKGKPLCQERSILHGRCMSPRGHDPERGHQTIALSEDGLTHHAQRWGMPMYPVLTWGGKEPTRTLTGDEIKDWVSR